MLEALCISGHSQFSDTKCYRSRNSLFSDFLVFFFQLFFGILPKKYAPISEILGSIQRTVSQYLLCIHAQLFLTQNYGPRKSQNYEFLTVFRNVLIFFCEPPCQTWVFDFNQNCSLGESLLDKWLRPFLKIKYYDSQKCQLSNLLSFLWTFLDNYPAKSDIMGLIDTTDYLYKATPSFLREI